MTYRKSERHKITDLHDVDFSTRPLEEEDDPLVSRCWLVPGIVETRPFQHGVRGSGLGARSWVDAALILYANVSILQGFKT